MPYRLLETGYVRLTEAGGRRLLEAAFTPDTPAEVTLIAPAITRTLTAEPIERTLTAQPITRTLIASDPE